MNQMFTLYLNGQKRGRTKYSCHVMQAFAVIRRRDYSMKKAIRKNADSFLLFHILVLFVHLVHNRRRLHRYLYPRGNETAFNRVSHGSDI